MVSANHQSIVQYSGDLSLSKEVALVRNGLSTSVMSSGKWHPIAMDWFMRWKIYSNMDNTVPEPRDPEEVRSLHPGPVNNSSLRHSAAYPSELRKGLVEGRDMVLLPIDIAHVLFRSYGGEPEFTRATINVGTSYAPVYQINLYPIRAEAYYCTADHNILDQSCKSYFSRGYYKKTDTFDIMLKSMRDKFGIMETLVNVRYWLRVPSHTQSNQDCKESEEPTEDNAKKRARTGRHLTAEVVGWYEDWKLIPRTNKQQPILACSLLELLGENDGIEVIIEVTKSTASLNTTWPRDKQANHWKHFLQRGDLVDVADKTKKWYEALVKDIDKNYNITVHFLAWDKEYDEVLPSASIESRIRPLHAETFNRENWAIGDSVEVKILDVKPRWVEGRIADVRDDEVYVTYAPLVSRSPAEKPDVASSAADSNEDDDSIKKNAAAAAKNRAPFVDDIENEDGEVWNRKKSAAQDTSEWLARYSERVCPINVHINKPKNFSSFNPSLRSSNLPFTTAPGYSSTYSSTSSSTSIGTSTSYSYSPYSYGYDLNSRGRPSAPGAVGLGNLGNTCFMNSILQCLSNTSLLTQTLILSNLYTSQINYSNPLGHNGKVINAYAKVVKDMWSNEYTRVTPREFKTVIGEFQPQFAGYEQQDAQEFMGFLLDGLHEDLNRVETKPYVTKIESKGRPDNIIAAESWRRYLLRNNSFLTDHIFALLKSHVTCTHCRNESVTFDAYNAISLPIPIKNTKEIAALVQLLVHEESGIVVKWVKLVLEVEVSQVMADLRDIIIAQLKERGLYDQLYKSRESPSSDSDRSSAVDGGEFEMVSPPDDDYDMVSPPHAPSNSDSSSQEDRDAGGVYFHYALAYSTRLTTIYKNYNRADTAKVSIVSFVNKMDSLLVFQLAHSAPDFKTHSYTGSSYGTGHISSIVPPSTNSAAAAAMDVMYAVTSLHDRLDIVGLPHRLTVPLRCSNQHVYELVKQMLIASLARKASHLLAGSDDQADGPLPAEFSLVVTNMYGSVVFREVSNDSAIFTVPEESRQVLCVVLRGKLVNEGSSGKGSGDVVAILRDHLIESSTPTPSRESPTAANAAISIYDCLDKFIERETLASTETLYCSACKNHLPPIKKMDIYNTPDVLILHLKRFQFIPGQYFVHREKISQVVAFPIEGLDLRKYVIGSEFLHENGDFVNVNAEDDRFIYDLYAVSHHMGGLGGGHYTASCLNPTTGQWYYFNDSSVNTCQPESVVSGTAYVLFYKRRKGTMKWGGLQPSAEPMPDEEST